MKAGDIVFVTGHSPISWAVRKMDKGKFSHVSVAVSDTHIIEAVYNTKVHITPLKDKDFEVVDLGLNEEDRETIVHEAINLTGKRYDYLQILGYFFSTKTRLGSPNSLICSELVYELLQDIGIEAGDRFIKPNELYELLKQRIDAA